ncbi:hypothetical protein BS50DRAFT_87612 [Corynespora cassiicola Philippines]|uniref:Uncharacterized protein n=1 Tax=Corynespora cassiicola Philippines TaxID=1448308 RepID=A0A2T2NE72_CORCC|nr:hypothetical protein BS50DRAFT_87612 [Corynespora cassiicola Philippines]
MTNVNALTARRARTRSATQSSSYSNMITSKPSPPTRKIPPTKPINVASLPPKGGSRANCLPARTRYNSKQPKPPIPSSPYHNMFPSFPMRPACLPACLPTLTPHPLPPYISLQATHQAFTARRHNGYLACTPRRSLNLTDKAIFSNPDPAITEVDGYVVYGANYTLFLLAISQPPSLSPAVIPKSPPSLLPSHPNTIPRPPSPQKPPQHANNATRQCNSTPRSAPSPPYSLRKSGGGRETVCLCVSIIPRCVGRFRASSRAPNARARRRLQRCKLESCSRPGVAESSHRSAYGQG